MKCICINDKNRPADIPESHWIKFGETYTVTTVKFIPNGTIGLAIEEISLEGISTKYDCFALIRFGFHENDMQELIALLEQAPHPVTMNVSKAFESNVLVGNSLGDLSDYHESDDENQSLGAL